MKPTSLIFIPSDLESPPSLKREDHGFELAHLQHLVAGPIQQVPNADPTIQIVCNEEGKLHDLATNMRATALWASLHNLDLQELNDVLVGDVLVFGGTSEEGEYLSPSDDVKIRVMDYHCRTVFGDEKPRPFCPECLSLDVVRGADAAWNEDLGRWELATVYDTFDCHGPCGKPDITPLWTKIPD